MVTKGYGFSVDDIDWSCPADLEPYAKAHECEVKEKDGLMYAWFGEYALSAVSVAIEHNLAGRKAKSKYAESTIFERWENKKYNEKKDRKEYIGMTEEEKEKAEWERAKCYFDSIAARFPKKEGGSK